MSLGFGRIKMILFLLFTVVFFSAYVTAVFRRYALRKQMLDIPNHRSSHQTPTPRGGGIAIVLVYLGFLSIFTLYHWITVQFYLAMLVPGGIIAWIGLMDDRAPIHPVWRFLGHLMAALLGLFLLGGMPPVSVFGWQLSSFVVLNLLGGLFLCWLLNLYNFMDGIDGLASIEAISVACGAAIIFFAYQEWSLLAVVLTLAAAVGGFLYWNFPPARIFMGDAGSGFLGILFGILTIYSAQRVPQWLWCWLILLGVFIMDATMTLLRRLCRGEKIYEAHRSHAYQHAVQKYGSHLRVSLGVLCINVIWLYPIAFLVAQRTIVASLGLVLAYVPLGILAWYFNAGVDTCLSTSDQAGT